MRCRSKVDMQGSITLSQPLLAIRFEGSKDEKLNQSSTSQNKLSLPSGARNIVKSTEIGV